MDDDYEMFKIVVIGSTGTGKTNIATRYIRNEFNEGQKATVGVQFLSKIVQVRSQNIKVTLWDTAGQQRYKSLSKVYYKGATGVLIVYDVTQPQTYIDVQSWLRLANENLNLNQVVLMVVGNKVDLQNEIKVPKDRVLREYKQKFDIDCWQVSAKTGYNVKEVFAQLLERIYEKNMQNKDDYNDGDEYRESVDPSQVIGSKMQPRQPSVAETKDQSTIKVTNIMKNPQQNAPVSKPKTQPKKAQPEPKVAPVKAQNKITLNAADEKKRAKESKQKNKGCC